jgi:hypothetical protein
MEKSGREGEGSAGFSPNFLIEATEDDHLNITFILALLYVKKSRLTDL